MSEKSYRSLRSLAAWQSIAVIVACLTGCSSQPDWQADAYPTSGTVRINGETAINAFVMFHSLGGDVDVRKSEPWGIVGADGVYHVSTYGDQDGAPLGEYAVTVTWPKNMRDPYSSDRMSNKFASKEKAPLVVTIAPGRNELPPIELNDVKLR